MKTPISCHIAALLFFAALAIANSQLLPGPFNIDPKSVSVSGLSAGGYAAQQFHVAFSASVRGAGIIAGGPYYCARGNLNTALLQCMTSGIFINVPQLVSAARECGNRGGCDSIDYIRESKVWLFSGTLDYTVVPGVMRKLQQFYQSLLVTNIDAVFNLTASHSWPTRSYGTPCALSTSPYISNCMYSASEALLTHIYGPLKKIKLRKKNLAGQVVQYSQASYFNGSSPAAGLHPNGFVFVPSACEKGEQCRIHVAYHGCQMTQDLIARQFVDNSELIELGEANNIVIVFPQAIASSLIPYNPNGCFDWWGYTGRDYAEKSGVQNQFVRTVVNTLAGQEIVV